MERNFIPVIRDLRSPGPEEEGSIPRRRHWKRSRVLGEVGWTGPRPSLVTNTKKSGLHRQRPSCGNWETGQSNQRKKKGRIACFTHSLLQERERRKETRKEKTIADVGGSGINFMKKRWTGVPSGW